MNETHPISIAIDGPSGAGKSTLARRLATTLRFLYVDTGAIYRTIAYYAYANHLDPADEAAVLAALPNIRIELCHDAEGLQRMILNGEDVTDAIRLPQISQYASVVSAYPGVRAFLLEMQRDFARKGSVIMDGRDIGTVVLPQADVKIFLTASPEAVPAAGAWSWSSGERRSPLIRCSRRSSSGTGTTPTGRRPLCGRQRTLWWWTPRN